MANLSIMRACQGKVLADLHARHVGRDRFELAAKLHGSIRLEVVHVQVRRTARAVRS